MSELHTITLKVECEALTGEVLENAEADGGWDFINLEYPKDIKRVGVYPVSGLVHAVEPFGMSDVEAPEMFYVLVELRARFKRVIHPDMETTVSFLFVAGNKA